MRHIHLDNGLRLRFPGRCAEFDQGVEIGMLAVLMDSRLTEFSRRVGRDNLDQVRAVARQMGYHVLETGEPDGEFVELIFRHGSTRPSLKVVHSAR
ncbi:hypothetical protein [Microvirga thermotolerans]|uniref:Uncharacterized protein n=1 Tax=Microvirga thermotolerans TaxID=2651334 RepID=A0A5P9JUX4_9HYPH|nr:hypothetical protein [Microvirga thermotolerans]QFU15901.1 hypothetical protein GDR74_06510 [Microvirga thermotolerans]